MCVREGGRESSYSWHVISGEIHVILVLANYNPALSYWYLFFEPLEDRGLVIFKYAVLTLVSCQPYKTKSACYKVEIYPVFYLLSCYCVCDY